MTQSMLSRAFGLTLNGPLAALVVAAATLMAGVAPALAQDPPPPPKYEAVDANGVDLLSGSISVSQPVNSIGGDGPGGLGASEVIRFGQPLSSQYSYVLLTREGEFGDSFHTTVVLLGETETFEGTPSTGAMPDSFTSGQIYVEGTDLVYVQKDGTIARFQKVTLGTTGPAKRVGYLKSVAFPSGETLTVDFVYGGNMLIESSLGYAMTGNIYGSRWSPVAANLTQGGCAGAACSGPTFTYQAALGRSLTSSVNSGTLTLANPAGGAARTYEMDGLEGRVSSYTDGVGTWTYAYSEVLDAWGPQDGVRTTTATDPLGNKRVVRTRMSNQHILSDTVGIKPDGTGGQTTTFQYSADAVRSGFGFLTQITWPEGNRSRYEYDDYYNVEKKWTDPKSEPGPTSTLVEASYNTVLCTGIKVCDRPDWIKDERDHQTDFTYSPDHGGVLTVTKPAGPNGVRPQTRYTYGQFAARYIQNASLTAAPPVWRLTQTSTCQTLAGETPETPTTPKIPAACLGTADEVVTTYAYENSAVANNVRLLSVNTRSGDNALSATTSYAYNARGDVVTVDGPLAGPADTTRTYYDASRWKVGEIGPDPLLHRASRTTYRADGLMTLVETGTATSQSDTTMGSFTPLAFTRYSYGPTGRLTKTETGQP